MTLAADCSSERPCQRSSDRRRRRLLVADWCMQTRMALASSFALAWGSGHTVSAGARLHPHPLVALCTAADLGHLQESPNTATKKQESRLRLKMQPGSTTPTRTQQRSREACNAGLKPHWSRVFTALATENEMECLGSHKMTGSGKRKELPRSCK